MKVIGQQGQQSIHFTCLTWIEQFYNSSNKRQQDEQGIKTYSCSKRYSYIITTRVNESLFAWLRRRDSDRRLNHVNIFWFSPINQYLTIFELWSSLIVLMFSILLNLACCLVKDVLMFKSVLMFSLLLNLACCRVEDWPDLSALSHCLETNTVPTKKVFYPKLNILDETARNLSSNLARRHVFCP